MSINNLYKIRKVLKNKQIYYIIYEILCFIKYKIYAYILYKILRINNKLIEEECIHEFTCKSGTKCKEI